MLNKSMLEKKKRPLRVAIVGSGPSGFYAADVLQKSNEPTDISMFEKLPMPFGLVRYGVAPDHAKIKLVSKVYDRIAKNEHFTFWGNVTIGKDLSVCELQQYYDAVIIACGAQTDRPLPLSNLSLRGSFSATEFVAWYNSHPDYQAYTFDLNHPSAVIIGHGNVALDIARILGKTESELSATDISCQALAILGNSQIKDIHVVGRRGPLQATFTDSEVKELACLEDCDVVVKASDLELSEEEQEEMNHPDNKQSRKNINALRYLLEEGNSGKKSKRIWIHFFQSPLEVIGEESVTGIVLGLNVLRHKEGSLKIVTTSQRKTLNCQLLIRSIGYRGVPLEGLPFDKEKGIIPHANGCVLGMKSVYVVGWI